MPSFPFLKSHREDGSQIDGNGHTTALEATASEKKERRRSKREYFRSLLKRSSFTTQSKADKRKGVHLGKPSPHPSSTPESPMNKPLPATPTADTPDEAPKPPVQLQRIISPLSTQEVHNLFSGAPQFFCRSDAIHSGNQAPHPSVAFPWNLDVRIRDLSDHIRIQDEAWRCITAWPHITAQIYQNVEARKEMGRKNKARFLPRARERPCMLSMQGVERGTVGFEAALESSVADASVLAPEISPESLQSKRLEFLQRKDGVRPITDSMLVDCLIEIGEQYQENPSKVRKSTVQMYTELFTQLLFPPSRVIDSEDPYSLEVQIESLVLVLASPDIWFDFTLVEWRIRLGSILWSSPSEIDESGTKKYWLLLQVLLACELLVRLDAISMDFDKGKGVGVKEIERYEKIVTVSAKWSLHLARAWLDNIRLEKPVVDEATREEKKPAGWLASLTGTAEAETRPVPMDLLEGLTFHGRQQKRQLQGLIHFARRMQWPDIEALEAKIAANSILITSPTSESTAATPMSISMNRSSSYFGKPNRKPGLRRGLSRLSTLWTIVNPSGWLSNSYLSGLVLPGEGLSHFIMGTLLENDTEAVERLGEEANLYGGFIYAGRSWWSTACVVGRVLAAGKGATECLGWVAADVCPRGAAEGWVDIDVETSPPLPKDLKPLIYHKTTIETNGHVLGAADPSSILPGDFTLPADDFSPPFLSTKFEGLDLFAAVDSETSTQLASPTSAETRITSESGTSASREVRTYSAMMRFTIGGGEGEDESKKEMSFSLSHDVCFVTAHPCVVDNTSAKLIGETFKSERSSAGKEDTGPGHPLHKAHKYTTLPLSTILSIPSSTPLSTLLSSFTTSITPLSPAQKSSPPSPTSPKQNILVIDATFSTQRDVSRTKGIKRSQFGSDSEMLARAVCAERGWSGLVSRRGRSCLACCVREAGALGGLGVGDGDGGGWVVVRVA